MDGYDTMNMQYLGGPMQMGSIQPPMDFLSSLPGIDMADQHSNFDTDTFLSGDDMAFAPHSGMHPGLLKRYSGGLEDPFPDQLQPYDPLQQPESAHPESPSVDRDNKLLSFSMPVYSFTLLDYSLRRTALSLSAQMNGMFFLAESQFASNSPDQPPPPPELTCYRRNLFQITGSITLPRTLRYIMTDQGDRIPILAQELTVSATESVEGNAVKIISVPWKTPAGGQAASAAEEKVEKEPPSIPLDTMAGQDMDADYATFPISWKRLQFRIATANNGRRKELQQHFVLRLKLVATLSTGAKVSIAEAHSGAIIVRGRSPRNFQSRKDYPLGNSASSRKNVHASISRVSTGESVTSPTLPSAPAAKQMKTTPEATDGPPQVVFPFDTNPTSNSSPSLPQDWQNLPQDQKSNLSSTPLATPTYPFPHPGLQQSTQAVQGGSWSTSNDFASGQVSLTHPNIAAMQASAPVNLTFSDDDSSPGSAFAMPVPSTSGPTSNPSPQFPTSGAKLSSSPPSFGPTSAPQIADPPKRPRLDSHRKSSSTVTPLNNAQNANRLSSQSPHLRKSVQSAIPFPVSPADPSGIGNVDHLYEYFPLSIEEWLPPVDAVYRPHIVHHTGPQPLDSKSLSAGKFRSKRYFSEVESS